MEAETTLKTVGVAVNSYSAMSLMRRPSQELNETQLGKLSLSDTKLPSRRQDAGCNSLSNASSVEQEENAVARRFSGGIAVLQAGSVAENLVNAFLSANQHVLQKVQSLPNGKQLLDICELYRSDAFSVLTKFLPDLAALWTAAAMRDAAPVYVSIFSGLDLSLVNTHRMLGGINRMTIHEKHREYLEDIDVASLLKKALANAIMDHYAVHPPMWNYSWLVEYMKVLSILFPEWAGYDVVDGIGEFFDVELVYGAVVTTGCNPKVVLIVKGIMGLCRGIERIDEHHQELNVWDMSKRMRKDGAACFPERMFWLCFRGVHCGVGWQEGEALAQRFWPDEDSIYQDVRKESSIRMLCSFVQLVVDRMMQCGVPSRALVHSVEGRDP
ncbi:uncharacterized protein LOC129582363 [Paramacrobiotus metropolitanus]|uniref:uncharacterized protein LOC129582363 n=1 Tax=Paramacrobiotus metropolitanus TaxID=2943436 RepID=UPI00244625C9|nr:uncharacterized protein LOC129582363 [Paramacrobiotus metropolitanus]